MAERVGPNCRRLEIADPEMVEPLTGKDIEMVEPEIDHDLLQLALAVERAPDTRILGLLHDDLRPLPPREWAGLCPVARALRR